MRIEITDTIQKKYQDFPVELNIFTSDPLSGKTWIKLINSSIQNYNPYYHLAFVITKNIDGSVYYKPCDGTYLYTYLDSISENSKSSVLDIYHLFFKCFDFKNDNGLPTFKRKIPDQSEYTVREFSSLNLSNMGDDLLQIALDGLNLYAHRTKINKELLAENQYTFGAHLLEDDYIEGMRWIWCAAHNGNTKAKLHMGCELIDSDVFRMAKKKGEEWLSQAAKEGSSDAKSLLQSLNKLE